MADTTEIVTTNPPPLELRAAGRTWHATAGRTWTIGRATDADVHLDNPRVSRDHALLEPTPAGWVLVNRSRNGMFVDGQRVERLTIRHPITVSLGSVSSGQMLQLYPGADPAASPTVPDRAEDRSPRQTDRIGARSPTAVHTVEQVTVTIGRGLENNVVIADPLVSRRHALLRRSGNQWELVDLNSPNGTYVNGARISRAVIGPDDIVGIGHKRLHLSGDRLVEYVDPGDVS
jgi:ABC transport system ATP-binding/permease protein